MRSMNGVLEMGAKVFKFEEDSEGKSLSLFAEYERDGRYVGD